MCMCLVKIRYVLAGGNDKAILDFRQASVNRINYWSELESLPLAWKENERDLICAFLCLFVLCVSDILV